MKILFSYLSRYRKYVLLSFLLAAVNQSFSLLDPVFMGRLFDYVRENAKPQYLNYEQYFSSTYVSKVIYFILCMLGVAMVSRIAKAFQDFTVNTVIQRFGADVYTDGLKHALKLPYQKFEDQRSGETLSILEKVKADCEKLISSFINVLFAVLVSVVFVIVYSLTHYPPIVFIYLIGSILLSFLMSALSKKYKLIQRKIVSETTRLAGATTESLRNIELVRSLGLTDQEVGRLNNTTRSILQLELRKVKSLRTLSFAQGTFVNFMRQCIVFGLCSAVFTGHLSQGQMLTMQFFSFFIFGPLQELGNIIIAYREAEASLTNFENLMHSPIEEMPSNATDIADVQTLSFNKVSYQHLTARTKALNEISFEANKGETIAFVGPSGSGKTTLVKLLVGLYKPKEGNVYFNGVDSNSINYELFRKHIGFVTQDTQLFSGTIRENLLFVNPQASEQDMMQVLQRASCTSILDRSNDGLDTKIGEGGMKVSGGEKQRLSIARALLRNPKLLVFDEATSALDSITEEEISNTIKHISKDGDRLTLMIAHRLSTIMHATRIYVLEKGNIVETGTHDSLVAEKGLYYAMWRQQIGERAKEI